MYKRYGVLSGNRAFTRGSVRGLEIGLVFLLFFLDLALSPLGVSFALLYACFSKDYMMLMLFWALVSDAFCLSFPFHTFFVIALLFLYNLLNYIGLMKNDTLRPLFLLTVFSIIANKLPMCPFLAGQFLLSVSFWYVTKISRYGH